MLDHKRAIKGLEHCTAWAGLSQCQPKIGDDCPYEDEADCKLALMQDALASLREGEKERLDFIEAVAKLTAENELLKKPDVVRCRDCKHHGEGTCSAGAGKEQEPKTGYWIDSVGDDKCSVCGATYSDLFPDYQNTHYCPNCGAKMIGQEVK